MPRSCRYCIHWTSPTEETERAYEAFRLGQARKRVRKPTGTCDHVQLISGKPPSFASTEPSFYCLNFTAKPVVRRESGDGYVTIYQGDHSAWQGEEKDIPAEFDEGTETSGLSKRPERGN